MTGAGRLAAAAEALDVLARRGAIDVIDALLDGALPERAVVSRRDGVAESVLRQRVEDLRRLDIVEVVPETGDYRLSPNGRRLQGILVELSAWSAGRPRRRS